LSHDGNPDLVIGKNTTLLLDKSGTPNTHTQGKGNCEFPDFIRPTTLTLNDSSTLVLDSHSKIILTDSSSLYVGPHCTLELKENALLVVNDHSALLCSSKGKILLQEKSKIL